jgi:hypothetical protein
MKKLYIIAERPSHIPKHWIICNAPRPLMGTDTWGGDFRHGIFYAAIDPADEFAEMNLDTNRKLDAWELVFYTEGEARNALKEICKKYADKIDALSIETIRESFLYQMNKR